MEISRRTDYAIRLIAALAASDGTPLSVRSVAEMQDVPYAFARSIQHDLVLAGLVGSRRGAQGGMVLVCDPQNLTLLDIIEAIQGDVGVAVCSREENWCDRSTTCPFHEVWAGADKLLRDYLSSVSIKDLMAGIPATLPNADDAEKN